MNLELLINLQKQLLSDRLIIFYTCVIYCQIHNDQRSSKFQFLIFLTETKLKEPAAGFTSIHVSLIGFLA